MKKSKAKKPKAKPGPREERLIITEDPALAIAKLFKAKPKR